MRILWKASSVSLSANVAIRYKYKSTLSVKLTKNAN
jgi:hypothetical protein